MRVSEPFAGALLPPPFALCDSKPKHGLPSLFCLQDCLRQTELPRCCVESSLDAAALRFPLQRAPPSHLSLALTPRLAPLGSSLASCFGPHRLISAHTRSLTPSRPHFSSGRCHVPSLVERLAQSSTSSRPLFSLEQRRHLTPWSSTPPPPLPPCLRLNTVASTFDTSSSSWTTLRLFLKMLDLIVNASRRHATLSSNTSTPLGDTSQRLRPLVDSTATSTLSKPSSGCLSMSRALLCFLCLGLNLHI